jgi:ATP-binding cassette subfamily C protein CydC
MTASVRPGPFAGGSTLARLMRLAAPFWHGILLAAFLGFATIASGVGLMTTSAYLIARAALQPSIAELQVAIVGVRFFGIARGLFRYLERNVSHQLNFRLLARLRVWLYRALEPLAPAGLVQHRSGDLLARIVADIETLENLYVRVLAPPLVAVLMGALMALFMGSLSATLAIVLLAALALGGLGLPLLAQHLGRPIGRDAVQARAELNWTLVDGVQGAADLLAFGAETAHQQRIRTLGRRLIHLQRCAASLGGLQEALSGLLMNLATLAVLAIAIPLVRGGSLDGVSLAVLVLAVISSFEAVLPLPLAFQHLESNLAAGRRLFEIVDAEPMVQDPHSPLPVPRPLPPLRVHDLTFHYGPDLPPALEGLGFILPPGGRLALVGPSGAGKSTLINLLLRFWEYDQGSIRLGDTEIRQLNQDELRESIGVVSQHTHLFGGTVRENLMMARPEAREEELIHAARRAHLHDFVRSLPQGYDSWIGEQGLRLSGGERQRIAIARAILQDAPLLILDEPTANLDAITERQIMDELREVMEARTTLLVTHRLVGLEAMDEILVLRAGRVVERGCHHDLIQLGGLYARMWELQRQILRG